MCSILSEIGLIPIIPKGSYYILSDISNVPGNTSKEKVMHILKITGVATVPGEAFYNSRKGDNLSRICFAKNYDILLEAVKRLRKLQL